MSSLDLFIFQLFRFGFRSISNTFFHYENRKWEETNSNTTKERWTNTRKKYIEKNWRRKKQQKYKILHCLPKHNVCVCIYVECDVCTYARCVLNHWYCCGVSDHPSKNIIYSSLWRVLFWSLADNLTFLCACSLVFFQFYFNFIYFFFIHLFFILVCHLVNCDRSVDSFFPSFAHFFHDDFRFFFFFEQFNSFSLQAFYILHNDCTTTSNMRNRRMIELN